ncbi:MAG TPA: S8 family peptidase [Allosphingosinicella sp.]|jgi:hypothetical protein|nr:S8 family peptidase [Allosphingosinicella sp.]
MATKNRILRSLSVSVLVLALGACGGGGGGGGGVEPIPAPPPPPPPPPPAPPPPPSSGFDTAEYKNSAAAARANAISAYDKGATGKAVTAAIIDDSFASTIPAFTGRVHPASGDVVAGRGLDGEHHHGTPVASILGASKDDSGMHGVAFDATLLMLRTDTPGTCTATSPTCQFNQADLAKAYDIAVANGARVINMSMALYPQPVLIEAIERATAAGVVVILPAANDGQPEPFASALIATKPEGHGTIIIAGALNNAGTDLASFSNRAGSGANFYLSAVGQGLVTYNREGVAVCCGLGTSLSAPAIAGAVALLAQAFPNLTGQQIVNLLLTTATDMGAPGTDNIYGRGALNLANAFAPQGAMSLAGSTATLSLTSNGVLSPAMGDAKGKLDGAVFLDGYARAYRMDLGRTLSPSAGEAPLRSALDGRYSTTSAALGPIAVSVTTRRDALGPSEARLQPMALSAEQARTARAMAATAIGRLSPRTAMALGFSEGGRTLQQRLSGQQGSAFLVAGDAAGDNGFHALAGSSIGVRHDFGPLAVTMTSEGGEVYEPYAAQHSAPSAYRITALVADRRLGRLRLSLGGSLLDEESTILGGRFSSAFAGAGSTSRFADGAASLDLGGGWGARAAYRHGWTSIRGGGALIQGGRLSTDAFALDLARAGALAPGDRIGLRIVQPLRVRSGGLNVDLPVGYDYASGEVDYQLRFLNLAPTGRELDYELSYGLPLLGGYMAANAFARTEPGHIEAMRSDFGGALRFTLGF